VSGNGRSFESGRGNRRTVDRDESLGTVVEREPTPQKDGVCGPVNVFAVSNGNTDMGKTTVSAKVPEELKEQLDQAEINISEAIREALEERIRQQRRAELGHRASEIQSSIESERITAAVRSDRDDR
jgi:antitoxin CcdA